MMETLGSVGIAVTIIIGGQQVINGEITVGSFFSFLTALFMLYTPIKNIGKNFNAVQLSLMAIERVFEMIDMPIQIDEKENATQLQVEFSKQNHLLTIDNK